MPGLDFISHFGRSVIFTIEILSANFIFWLPFDRKRFFALRFALSAAVMTLCSAVLFYLTRDTVFNDIVSFAFCLLFLLRMAKICFHISWYDSIFCAIAGYSVQFMGSIASEFVHRLLFLDRWPIEIFITAIIYVFMYQLYGKRIRKGQNLDINRKWQFFLLIGAALAYIVICGIMRSYWLMPGNRSIMVCTMVLMFLTTFTILALQFSLLTQKTLTDELVIVSQLVKKEQAQYRLSRETIDSINRKCHDMRHQIRTIGNQENINPEAIREMTEAIRIYDSLYKTGSAALDIILAEKTLYCQDKKISINCMSDGQKLSFMSDTDIYSLFGNILENAINAVSELPENDRDIYLSIVSKGEMLSINARNPCRERITMKDGLPVTKNADAENHGIGTRSIQFIVEKYGGTVNFEGNDNIFYVSILFPFLG